MGAMSEQPKEQPAQAELPGTPAKVDAKETAPEQTRDYAAELKALESRAAKAEKRAKDVESKLTETTGLMEKIKSAFGGDGKDVDPVAKAKELEQHNGALASKYKSAVLRNELTSQLVANKVRPDLLKHALRLIEVDAEVDLDAGRVKNAEAVTEAVAAFKAEYASVYFEQPAAPVAEGKPSVKAGSVPANPKQPESGKPQPEMTPEMAMKLPIGELRKWRADQIAKGH